MAETDVSTVPFVERMPRHPLVWNNHSMAWISDKIAGIVENKAPRWWWISIAITASFAAFGTFCILYQSLSRSDDALRGDLRRNLSWNSRRTDLDGLVSGADSEPKLDLAELPKSVDVGRLCGLHLFHGIGPFLVSRFGAGLGDDA
jgi:hypothetical protein